MPVGPLSVLFPVGLIAALAALALGSGDAEASKLPSDRIEPEPGKNDLVLSPRPTSIQTHPGTGLPMVQPIAPAATAPAQNVYRPQTIETVNVPGVGPLPRVVSFKDWEKDRARKMKSNNCGPGMRPEFFPHDGGWAEYRCVPDSSQAIAQQGKSSVISIVNKQAASLPPAKERISVEKQSDVSKIVSKQEKPAAKQPVAKRPVSRMTEVNPSAVKKDKETGLPVVVKTEYEPQAKPFVDEAVNSRNAQLIQDQADAIRSEFPRAAAYLDRRAGEFAIKAIKPAAEKKTSVTQIVVSKNDWEADKARKLRDNNCQDGTSPEFKPYSKNWAEYACTIRPEIARAMQTLRAEGIESDVEVSVAVFLSKKPSPNEARAFARQYEKSKPKAAARLIQYAKNQEVLSDAMARGKPTKPIEIVKAASKTNNPSELLKHAKTLEATGNVKAAAAVKSQAKTEAAKQGVTIIDESTSSDMLSFARTLNDPAKIREISATLRKGGFPKKADQADNRIKELEGQASSLRQAKAVSDLEKAGFVERKDKPAVKVDETKEKAKLAQSIKISDAQARADEAKEKKRLADEKTANKASAATAVIASKEKAKKEADEKAENERRKKIAQGINVNTTDPLGDLEAKIEAAEKERRQKAKKSGVSGFDYEPSQPLEIRSPIDGVTDAQWASFVKSMATGKANAVTPSYHLGMFAFGARRLADYGLMDNPRQVSYHDNTVWAGNWVEPWTLQEFLNDARAQYELFVEDMSSKASYIKEKNLVGSLVDGRKASLSGLLAVAFKTTEGSFGRWLGNHEDRKMFQDTTKLFEKANGLF